MDMSFIVLNIHENADIVDLGCKKLSLSKSGRLLLIYQSFLTFVMTHLR